MSASLVGSEMCIRDRTRKMICSVFASGWISFACVREKTERAREDARAVSYTHLTLPTICSV
eukprot:2068353-Alexandrium_andersonii.AAC.1